MIRRPPRSTLDRSSAASDVYKRQESRERARSKSDQAHVARVVATARLGAYRLGHDPGLSLIHISEPRDRTRSRMPSSA